ncbi:putative phage abortive infection protein [Desulfovibrio sp.]|uniref:putative phage abortive infection protein n=1 Tax=Desulfovibrio sp. TaxID=885 RepID=UPI0025BD0ABA|nr:putative phage abortive infection protein [Desulfovibrio sp.]
MIYEDEEWTYAFKKAAKAIEADKFQFNLYKFQTEKDINETLEARLTTIRDRYEKDKNIYVFDSYFRYFYRIIKFVHDADLQDIDPETEGKESAFDVFTKKSNYIDILRAQLSAYELVLLFYNSLACNCWKMKYYAMLYSIFDTLRVELLPSLLDIFLYDKYAFDLIRLAAIGEKTEEDICKEFELINVPATQEVAVTCSTCQQNFSRFYKKWKDDGIYLDNNYEEMLIKYSIFSRDTYRTIQIKLAALRLQQV